MFKEFSVWGRYAPWGVALIAASLGIDQAYKWWMLYVYNIAAQQPIQVTPFFDLVLVWNFGVSYGWLKGFDPKILIAGQLAICLLLWFWMAGSTDRISAIAIGLVIGGALGNIVDRIYYKAVADFFYLHAFGLSWYVFNLADVAIVAGAGLLVYASYKDLKRTTP